MRITKAQSAGFCVGVKRAIDTALKTARTEKNVSMLGDIVHNEQVIANIEKSGIKKIDVLADGRGKTLLIRAHGTGTAVIEKARTLGYKIIDATCPMVKEIHRIAKKMETDGRTIIIIGEKEHDEVKGIAGQLHNTPLTVHSIEDATKINHGKIARAGVVVQSTQNTDKVLPIVDALRARINDLEFHNTICQPTRIKQQEARTLPAQNDVVLVVGSKKSANTRRLFEISKNLNPRTYWVADKKDIDPQWFRDVKSVGATAGASTPDSTIEEIIHYLQKL